MRLQFKILLPIIGLFMFFLGLSGYLAYRDTSASLRESIADNMRGEADALARALQTLAYDSITNIKRVAGRAEVENFYKGDIHDFALNTPVITPAIKRIMESYPDFDRISLLDTKGVLVATSDPELSKPGSSFADRNYFQSAVAGTPFLAAPFFSRVVNRPVMASSAPVVLDGKIVGVVYATIGFENFYNNFVKPVKVGHDGHAYILNSDGLVVMSRNSEWLFNDKLPLIPTYRQWVKSGVPGRGEFSDNDGSSVLCAYRSEPTSKLTAVIQAESDDVFAGLYELRNDSILIILGSILLGSLLVFLVVRPIVRALNRGVTFATEIAAGHLDGELQVRRKDEIGKLADALRAIPLSLKEIVGEYTALEKKIEAGELLAEGDASKFSGDFASLIKGTNSILARFRSVIDNIPSPVVMLGGDLKATYLNTVARELAGNDYAGKTCKQLFEREDFNGATCALRKATETRSRASGETRAHPRGRAMDVSYTAIPMLNAKGEVASVLQLLTDLTEIRSTQRVIMDVAHQAMDISNRVATASEELSAQVEQVNQGSAIQRDRVTGTVTAMEEMNATVLEVARNAGQASEQADTTQRKAREGATLVSQVIQAIEEVNVVASELEQNMRELGKQAENIGGVMNVISAIADQTNLLALNAAIEAARAGDAGRGFAVVADEVRKLAENTMSATSEVGSSISGIQQATVKNIERVEVAGERVVRATELAGTSGAALSEILELANGNASLIAGIATAAEEQSATSDEINRAIEEIHRIADGTADGMSDAATAVQDLAQLALELKSLLNKLES